MKFTKTINKLIHKLSWQDMFIVKIDIVLFTLLLAKLFPVLTQAHWAVYVVVVVICELYLMQKLKIFDNSK